MPSKAKKPQPKSQESIEDLKAQLTNLQEKVARYETPTAPRVEIKELFAWSAPERLFIRRDKKWFTYVILLVMMVVLVLLFFNQWIIIAPVLAIAFVFYVLASVPPEDVDHRLTTQGLNSGQHSYLWQELGDFWFTQTHNQRMLNISTYLNYPRQLILLVNSEEEQNQIKELLVQFIPFREIPKLTWMDKAANYLGDKFHQIAG